MPGARNSGVCFICLFLLLLSPWSGQTQSAASRQDAAPPRSGKNFEKEMIQVANELNKHIAKNKSNPIGSKEARLRKAIGGPGNRLTLVIQVAELEAAPLSPAEMRKQVEDNDLQNICKDEHFKLLLQHEITITIRLLGKGEATVGDLNLTRKDCGY